MSESFEITCGACEIKLETGKLAKQADGAVTVTCGGTVVLVTACASKEAREGIDFFPLTVDYREKTSAAGKIPGGFFKREGRPTEKEILTSRLTDRPIRPLFPDGFVNEVQIMSMVISHDGENDPDVLSLLGASAALSISKIPFRGPIAALRIGRIDDKFVINPTNTERENATLDLVIAASEKGIIMVESGASEISDQVMLEALEFGHKEMAPLLKLQKDMVKKIGVPEMKFEVSLINQELLKKVEAASLSKVKKAFKIKDKEERSEAFGLIADELVEALVTEDGEVTKSDVKNALHEVEKKEVRRMILEDGVRIDGRKFDEVREISSEVSILPRTHGSGLFTRGQTQSLTTATLGTTRDEQRIDSLEGETTKSFMLHYNFPPFSVGEVRPNRGPGRREIGHGALAERALKPVIPTSEEFPYTLRVVSDILESNGSSSMATVCASTLALMDAGVPIKAPVSGIAMGLIKEGDKFVVLTDIMGDEDHFGDMDFKAAGTANGLTALQMDIKIDSVDIELIKVALEQANKARAFILSEMLKAIETPRGDVSVLAPRITTLKVPQDKIRDIIGPGGKMIKKITLDTGCSIDIQDDGTVLVASNDQEKAQQAIDIINQLTEVPKVGKIYNGTVKRIMNFGAFVEIIPGTEGLCHVSELADKFVKNVEDVVKVGDPLRVKLKEIDDQGRLNLTAKNIDKSKED